MSYLLVGTYTKTKSEGIYVCRSHFGNGTLSVCGYCKVANPSFIASGCSDGYIYSVTENETGRSYANSFVFDSESGKLTFLNRRVTGGAGACHISVDPQHKFAITANYGEGSISIFPIGTKGRLEPLTRNIVFAGKSICPERQEASHPHCTAFSTDGKYMFATDLGTDMIYRFDIDYDTKEFIVESSMKKFAVTPGSGPRHMVFHPQGNYLYVVNELSGTVTGYAYISGNLSIMQDVPIKDRRQEGGGAIAISADGKKFFVSLREGNDGIAEFGIDSNGTLKRREFYSTSLHPRGLCLSPDGEFLIAAAMKDNVVEVLRISNGTNPARQREELKLDTPVFVGFF